jgi:septum formation protein
MTALVLASGSPRRLQYLRELGYSPEVVPANVDETPLPPETAEDCARRLARAKARAVGVRRPEAVVLAADTVVVIGPDVLGKPADEQHFVSMMERLSGRPHQVITAVAVRGREGHLYETAVTSDVTFRPLTPAEIAWYWRSGEPRDKAGGYALQGLGGAFVERIDGSHSNVVGLPLVEAIALLSRAGVPPPWDAS